MDTQDPTQRLQAGTVRLKQFLSGSPGLPAFEVAPSWLGMEGEDGAKDLSAERQRYHGGGAVQDTGLHRGDLTGIGIDGGEHQSPTSILAVLDSNHALVAVRPRFPGFVDAQNSIRADQGGSPFEGAAKAAGDVGHDIVRESQQSVESDVDSALAVAPNREHLDRRSGVRHHHRETDGIDPDIPEASSALIGLQPNVVSIAGRQEEAEMTAEGL